MTVIILGGVAMGAFGASNQAVAIVAASIPLSACAVLTAGATARFRPEVASGSHSFKPCSGSPLSQSRLNLAREYFYLHGYLLG